MTRRSLTAAKLLAAFAFTAHAQSVVPGPRDDRPLAWRLERIWSVGGNDDPELVLENLFPFDLTTDARGRLLLIDRMENRIVEYDSSGQRTRTLGSRGMGPGELTYPRSISVAADGAIHVLDRETWSVIVFSQNGSIAPVYRVPTQLWDIRRLAESGMAGIAQRRDTLRLVVVRDGSTETLVSQVELPPRYTPPVCGVTGWIVTPIFAPSLSWASRGDRIVAATDAFAITVFDGPRPLRTLTRDAARRRSTPALARQQVGPGAWMQVVGERPCTVPAEMILSVAEIAREIPAYEALAIAPDGRIWATRFRVRGEAGFADVYDPVRGYEGTVALGNARPVAFLSTGALVSLEKDRDETPTVVVYAVRSR